jgi:ribosomal protein S18 acetylase RimI-like enzyme
MNNVSIRPLMKQDLSFVHGMTVVEKWNDRIEDIRRMFNCEPHGSFVAEIDSEPVGHVFTISYGKLGWIGLLIVKAEHRRVGVGALLTTKARDHLLSLGVETIRLEAVPGIADLYRKVGFTDEYDSLRFAGTPEGSSQSKDCSVTVSPLKKGMIGKVARFDEDYFGADRAKVLRRIYEDNPQLCFMSGADSQMIGYVMCRKAESGYKLGPWVCDPKRPEVARELFSACMGRLESEAKVYVGVPAVNRAAVRVLHELGFERYSRSVRMRFGNNPSDRVEGVFAITSPMKG